MTRKKIIKINKKAKAFDDKYPVVEVEWVDICSNAEWMTVQDLHDMTLPTCFTKGHLLTQKNGITRIFADTSKFFSSSTDDEGDLETIGNVTIIPNSVIRNIKKL